jgi:multiple sugar transport system permease protein
MATISRVLAGLRLKPLARREALWGVVFLSPWLVGFLVFTLAPMLAALGFTFTNINLSQEQPLQFVGLENYQRLLQDARTWESLAVTLKFGLLALPVGLALPLLLALLINSRHTRGKGLFRTLFYMPAVVPLVAGILAWAGMLSPESGWLSDGLRALGAEHVPNWLNDTRYVYPALVVLGLWGIGNALVINLAGLQNIPTELFDAAQVDGAGWSATLRHVTLPMMSPVIFYSLTLGLVELFQYFLVPLVLYDGSGRPAGTTMFYNLYLYKTFFTFQNMSYGATLAWLLFVIILALTGLLFWSAKYWVYYAGEQR